jgi:hypothetical protein
MRDAIEQARARLTADREQLARRQASLDTARERLLERARQA